MFLKEKKASRKQIQRSLDVYLEFESSLSRRSFCVDRSGFAFSTKGVEKVLELSGRHFAGTMRACERGDLTSFRLLLTGVGRKSSY